MSTKKYVLALLEENRGKSVSGEHIAEQLNVSRNAVWKAIKELEKEGYKIKAVTNKGYCLEEENDILSVQGMLPFLLRKDNARQIIIYDSLESTNKTAKEMAVSGVKQDTVIIAGYQTAGRGRFDRQFYSPPGCGIYMSFILRPEQLKFKTPTLITAFTAVVVCEAIETVSEKMPGIKWVNDVYIDQKKICGILTEAVTDFESGSMQWVVVGIGINFSTPSEDFPEHLRQTVGSVFPEGRQTVTRNQLAAEIINRILDSENYYDSKEILNKYKSRLIMLGKKISVIEARETYNAIAIDIDDIGRLVVEKENGERKLISSGEISIKI